jgi:hypothetical protein
MASADDLHTYREQLQQVQAALTNDPENDQLKKLAEDLKVCSASPVSQLFLFVRFNA